MVRPPPQAEWQFSWLRPLLHRVADASLALRSHYRFYSYTRAAIALDGSKDPPPAGDPYWTKYHAVIHVSSGESSGEPAVGLAEPWTPTPQGGDLTGAPPSSDELPERESEVPISNVDWAVGSKPMVCSTFVWAAIKEAEKTLGRRIEIEGLAEAVGNDGKSPHRQPGLLDGLYAYTARERLFAAHALHNRVKLTVDLTIHREQGGVWGAVADLAAFIEDMPDNVANQACNAFAVDRADEINAHHWEGPGPGDTVSRTISFFMVGLAPEPISKAFTACMAIRARPSGSRQLQVGARFPIPASGGHRTCAGSGSLSGPKTGALQRLPTLVRIGCQSGYTDANAGFSAVIGAGQVLISAHAYDPVLDVALGYEVKHLLTEGVNEINIDLQQPPSWRRRIVCFGETHIYHNPDVGPVATDTQPIATTHILAWDATLAAQRPPAHVWDYMTKMPLRGSSTNVVGHFVQYSFGISLNPDDSISFKGECSFYVDDELQADQTREMQGIIAPGAQDGFKYEVTHDAFLDSHDYGRIVLTIRIEWAKY